MYKTYVKIRLFDDKIFELATAGEIGNYHSVKGQEAVAVAACAELSQNDYVTSTHRGYAHCIAKGVELKKLMAEFYGKQAGLCKGKGGEMHVVDLEHGLLGQFAIVGAGIPVAVGAALASKLRGDGNITVSFFGDGAANTGIFHEALNMASVYKLPVLFVCENNGVQENTPCSETMNIDEIAVRARAYGMPATTVDVSNLMKMWDVFHKLIEELRKRSGPRLIEARTYRVGPHSVKFKDVRSESEIRNAIEGAERTFRTFETNLLELGVLNETKITEVMAEVTAEIKQAVECARASPWPSEKDALSDVFGDGD